MKRGLALAILVLAAGSVGAQDPASSPSPAPPPTGSRMDRLFLNFLEDAAVVQRQWWEGQFEYTDGAPIDSVLLRGVVAFQPLPSLEVGGRVGFGSTDTPAGFPDGSGATDLDVWGKYYFATPSGTTEFAAGAVVTVPTGDDTAGLGFDAFALGGFGSMRYNAKRFSWTGKIGLRLNEDGAILGSADVDGETSASIGAGVIWPWSKSVGFVGEVNYEDGRFEGADADTRALAGIQWHLSDRALLRGSATVGLSDGAPDLQALVGYAYTF